MHRPSLSPGRTSLRRAWATLALIGLVTASLGQSALAEAPKPVKKDSVAAARPKEVSITTSVSPARVYPGDTVEYKVTFKLKPGDHIYPYSKQDNEVGPKNTMFDFFDTAGLSVIGEWTASKEATKKKEPAFPDLDSVSFYADEVTWSLPLKVPADATPGKKVLRNQARYQVCNDQRCSFPGRWTMPDAVLEVVGPGNDQTAKASAAAAPAPPAAASTTVPKEKNSPDRNKPAQATLTASISPEEAKAGETLKLKVTAKLEPGWHIYDYAKTQPDDGPRVTQFDVFDTSGLKVAGEWSADKAPEVKEDPGFNNMLVSFFENEVTWTLPLTVPADATPGSRTLKVQAGYQVCNAQSCLPPGRWTLNDVMLSVVPGSAVIAAAPAVAEKPVAPPVGPKETVKAAAATDLPAVTSEVERKAQEGIIPLMITSALAGLLALVMPCVWPMVPITVNFFVKQGSANQANGGSTTGLAITYCLAIIGVFTTVGILFAFFISATALQKLANNPWLNFFVAGLFIVFGLSLLGLFEIRLPNSLLNASAKGESRGGLIGVVFMALTLTITSFTCTFPVVGGLLVLASKGQFFYPIIGLMTFSTVLALPFFLLALSPGLLSKMPKSGDWMNAVKVVGGLVEIGAAFKFLNTAELAFVTAENAWIDAEFIITAWVILAAVCGFYLLGFFRTDHDHEEVKVGPGRMVVGASFLGLALFLAPALFGRPPQSLVWSRVIAPILPPDAADLGQSSGGGGSATVAANEHKKIATSNDPIVAQREEKRFHGVWWGFSYEEALERAKAEGKPVLIDFTGVNCANCRLMENRVLPRPEVVELLKEFVTVELYTDLVQISTIPREERERLAEKNLELEIKLTNDYSNPFYAIVSPDGTLLAAKGGYHEPGVFVDFLRQALDKHRGAAKVAQRAGL